MIFRFLYRAAISAYAGAIRLAALFNPKAAKWIAGRNGLLEKMRLAFANEKRPTIWMHCASLGEFEQGRPVLERLRADYPDYAYLVTFFSPSGYEVRKNYSGADHVFYLPIDSPQNARDFIAIAKPALCIFVKYEFWYYYLDHIQQQQIPAIVISAIFHAQQPFFKWYGASMRHMLHCFSQLFVQDAHSAELLEKAGIRHVTVSGDTRFDRVLQAVKQRAEMPLVARFCEGHKVLVAGSTWKGDEQLLREAIGLLPGHWKLILVPHEVDDEHIAQIEKLYSGIATRWTKSKHSSAIEKRVLIVDEVGQLLSLYGYATAAWIGGGFGKEGVHNVLEAAVYGMPCFYGPIFQQYIEAQGLIANGGAFTVSKAGDLVQCLSELEDLHRYRQHAEAARAYVDSNSGATEIITQYAARYLRQQ